MNTEEGQRRYLLVHSGNATEVAKYLPSGYKVIDVERDHCIVARVDRAGWTLDAYVIPRLMFGWISSEELVGANQELIDGEFK